MLTARTKHGRDQSIMVQRVNTIVQKTKDHCQRIHFGDNIDRISDYIHKLRDYREVSPRRTRYEHLDSDDCSDDTEANDKFLHHVDDRLIASSYYELRTW